MEAKGHLFKNWMVILKFWFVQFDSLNFLDLLLAEIDEYKYLYDKLDKIEVDESLRPEKLNNDEILGFSGNFKKLDVD